MHVLDEFQSTGIKRTSGQVFGITCFALLKQFKYYKQTVIILRVSD